MFESLMVELTSLCDMECSFCSYGPMLRPRQHMDYGLFTSIIDQVAANYLAPNVELSAIGESLLHPRIYDAVAYCTSKGLKSGFITNGIMLTPDRYRKLVENGLDNLRISLHNLSPEAFRCRHAKSKIEFEAYYRNIMDVIELHVAIDCPIQLTVCLLFSKKKWISTELWEGLDAIGHDTERARELVEGFVMDLRAIASRHQAAIRLKPRHILWPLKRLDVFGYQLGIRLMKNLYISLVPLNPQLFNTRIKLAGDKGRNIILVKKTCGSCIYLHRPMILSNGDFIPCCLDGLAEVVMGRVDKKTSLLDVIKGEKYQTLLRSFRQRNIIHPVCQECQGTLKYRNPFRQFRYIVTPLYIYSALMSFIAKRLLPAGLKRFIKRIIYT
jgi:hypothetical protein